MNNINSWLASQIIYEIFPERFAIGKPYTSEAKLALKSYHPNDITYVRHHWDELPVIPPKGFDFFGGDINGIIDHLDYLQEIGVTTLFLTPIFISPSNHKYDTRDFFTVDEHFGGEKALKELINQLKQRKMYLFLDIAFNHISDMHNWFLAAKNGEYPYRNFFKFNDDGSYQCWRKFYQMPELNLLDEKLQGILFRNSDSVLQKYLNMGVDGFRFDVAVDVGLGIIRAIRQALRLKYPHAVMIGEVMNYAADWIDSTDKYHGVMNYYFHDALYSWLQGKITALQMNYATKEYYHGYGKEGAICSWNILSSHDTARLRNMLGDKKQRQLAVIAQFTLPGVPLIYYGEEIGMEGGEDPDCRRPMIWEESRCDMNTFELYKKLIAIRKSHPELQFGYFVMLGHKMSANALAFLRYTDKKNEVAIIVINNSSAPIKERIFTPHSHLYHNLPMKDLLSNSPTVKMQAGNVDLDIPAYSAAILVPDDTQFKDYKFFKDRNLS